MELTPDQENAIARLYENESLTENLTDQDARALLEWAQGQIAASTDDTLVRAAVSAANASGEQGVQALVTQASTFLAQELAARDINAARASSPQTAQTMGQPAPAPAAAVGGNETAAVTSSTASATTSPEPPAVPAAVEMTGRPVTGGDANLQVSGSAAEQNTLSGSSSANIGAGTTPAAPPSKSKRKKSRKSRRSKK